MPPSTRSRKIATTKPSTNVIFKLIEDTGEEELVEDTPPQIDVPKELADRLVRLLKVDIPNLSTLNVFAYSGRIIEAIKRVNSNATIDYFEGNEKSSFNIFIKHNNVISRSNDYLNVTTPKYDRMFGLLLLPNCLDYIKKMYKNLNSRGILVCIMLKEVSLPAGIPSDADISYYPLDNWDENDGRQIYVLKIEKTT